LLKKCIKLKEIPNPLQYRDFKNFKILIIEKKPGTQLSLKTFVSNPLIFVKLLYLIFLLAKIRIVHNDLLPKNILINKNYDLFLIDFDQATEQSFIFSILKSVISFRKNNHTILGLFKAMIKKELSNEFLIKCRKRFNPNYYNLKNINYYKTTKSKKLNKAWTIAKQSNASAPGVSLAYYSFEFEGYLFPGERSWKERWVTLKNITSLENKKILELGCNMSLLSCHIKREIKNTKVTSIDHDKNIIRSAKIIADVLEVKPKFHVLDLDKGNWENRFLNYDLVFCLNVLNWVKNKKKLLKFLGKFNELIFEGHDDYIIEKKRLKAIGFKNIKLISVTERNRPLIYCIKK
jgi:2-polyprenyl-3-methyl-5-hydroxy-6-metoxy-1,4-benzoquinol methylase